LTQLLALVPGTNSGANLPDKWQWSIDSVFIEYQDAGGTLRKKTYAFKVHWGTGTLRAGQGGVVVRR
jgi:hypothetical protein